MGNWGWERSPPLAEQSWGVACWSNPGDNTGGTGLRSVTAEVLGCKLSLGAAGSCPRALGSPPVCLRQSYVPLLTLWVPLHALGSPVFFRGSLAGS